MKGKRPLENQYDVNGRHQAEIMENNRNLYIDHIKNKGSGIDKNKD